MRGGYERRWSGREARRRSGRACPGSLAGRLRRLAPAARRGLRRARAGASDPALTAWVGPRPRRRGPRPGHFGRGVPEGQARVRRDGDRAAHPRLAGARPGSDRRREPPRSASPARTAGSARSSTRRSGASSRCVRPIVPSLRASATSSAPSTEAAAGPGIRAAPPTRTTRRPRSRRCVPAVSEPVRSRSAGRSPISARSSAKTAASRSSGDAPPMPSRPPGRSRHSWRPAATPGRPSFRYLAGLRRPDGSYRYSKRYATTPVWVTSQVLPALARRPFPLR